MHRPHRHIHRTVRVLAAMLLALCVVAPAGLAATTPDVDASEGFTVSPLRFDVSTNPGSSSQHSITVENSTSGKLKFRVSKEDVVGNSRDPLANPILTGGENESSISGYDWISSLPNDFTLDESESKTFSVKVTVPSGASGGHYAAVTITGSPRGFDSGTAESRVGILFMMNAGGAAPPELVIDDVYINGDDQTVIDYVNEGNKTVTPDATVTYVDPITGKTVAVMKAEDCTETLAGGTGRCVVEALDKNGGAESPSGLLRPEVELTNDGRSTKAALPTEWSGSWSSMILPLVGMGMLGLYVLRRRRRSVDDTELDLPL